MFKASTIVLVEERDRREERQRIAFDNCAKTEKSFQKPQRQPIPKERAHCHTSHSWIINQSISRLKAEIKRHLFSWSGIRKTVNRTQKDGKMTTRTRQKLSHILVIICIILLTCFLIFLWTAFKNGAFSTSTTFTNQLNEFNVSELDRRMEHSHQHHNFHINRHSNGEYSCLLLLFIDRFSC